MDKKLPRIKKNNSLIDNARLLRKNMTPQEKHLWYDYLQHYPTKIYKQRIIDDYIADFYCHSALLVIEIDGARHYTEQGKKHDEERTRILGKYGLCVIRFSNNDIDKKFEDVCQKIDQLIKDRLINLS